MKIHSDMKPQTKQRTWLERLNFKGYFISNPFISNSAQPQPLLHPLPSFLCQIVHSDVLFFYQHPDCVTIKGYRNNLLNLVFEKKTVKMLEDKFLAKIRIGFQWFSKLFLVPKTQVLHTS